MDNYVTGSTIKKLREKNRMTQAELADKLGVTAKAVSRWENARGLPDISLIEPLAKHLGVSLTELVTGETTINCNVSSNMLRSRIYVCPVCGNVIHSTGEAVISCCGVTLPPLEADDTDSDHQINIERNENEYYVTVDHDMTKAHYISFIACVTSERVDIVKLYPEGDTGVYFPMRGHGFIYAYCNRHGLMKKKI